MQLPSDATIGDLKVLIAQEAKIGDFNRVGIFDPSTKKTLKNRKAKLSDEPNVAAAQEVLVKDLGKHFHFCPLKNKGHADQQTSCFQDLKSPGEPSSSSSISDLSFSTPLLSPHDRIFTKMEPALCPRPNGSALA